MLSSVHDAGIGERAAYLAVKRAQVRWEHPLLRHRKRSTTQNSTSALIPRTVTSRSVLQISNDPLWSETSPRASCQHEVRETRPYFVSIWLFQQQELVCAWQSSQILIIWVGVRQRSSSLANTSSEKTRPQKAPSLEPPETKFGGSGRIAIMVDTTPNQGTTCSTFCDWSSKQTKQPAGSLQMNRRYPSLGSTMSKCAT